MSKQALIEEINLKNGDYYESLDEDVDGVDNDDTIANGANTTSTSKI